MQSTTQSPLADSPAQPLRSSRSVLLLPLALLLAGVAAFGQTTIPVGNQALLAGWDFDNILSGTISQPSRPRYSDVYGNNSSPTALTTAGGIYFNGSFGSDNWGTVAKNATGDINRDILTRAGSGSTFDLGGQTGQEGALNFNNANVGVTFDRFSLNVHTADANNTFKDLTLSLWGRDVEEHGVTIKWYYSVDGGATAVDTGLTSLFTTNAFTECELDLSSISALNGVADLYLIGEVVESNVAAVLNLDNIAVYGVAFSSGPPALTVWKGGDGSWNIGTAVLNWREAVGAADPAGRWNGGVATFAGTAGTVTVDDTDGPVTFVGAKFQVSGYTVAGDALVTTTAATPLEVGDGTGAGAAMTATIAAPLTGTGGINKTELGTLVLTAANTYAGATAVSGGTLKVDGNQSGATGGVAVASGGTLTGTGTLGGAVNVQDGGTLAGVTGSVLTMPGLVLSPNSLLNVTLGAPGTTGLFQVNGDLTLDGTLNVNATAGFGNGLYRIVDYSGALTNNGVAIGSVPGSPADFTVQTGTTGQVNVVTNITSLYWGGGSGNWVNNGPGWKTVSDAPANWTPSFALFTGTAGTVTVDDAGGPVTFNGAQFAVTGYTLAGDALTPASAGAEIRVGDGTGAGAAMVATIAAPFTGTGGINKRDLGTLVLTGANTHTGGTTVTEGTLQIGDGGTSGSVTGSITNNATVAFNRSDVHAHAGVISGSGALVKQGAGTTALTGANTYSGGTTVNAGTLSIGDGGTSGSVAGNITNNATVVFNRSDALTYAGNLSGTGTVAKQGAGTTALTGELSHTGGTTVGAGTLSIGSGGTTGSIAGDITNNATVAFNRSDALTYAGVISGTGAVTKQGAGTTTLTGANTYTGATTVSAGKLLVNGNQAGATGAVTVATGGTLGGSGALGGAVTVQNGGALEGRTGATLTTGALALGGTSNVNVTLGAPTTTALFQVNGNLTLDGTLNITGGTGFGEGLYRLFSYTGTLTDNTIAIGTAPVTASSFTLQTSVAQQVNLIYAALSLPIWNDSATVWSVSPTSGAWESADGATTGGWQPGVAIFAGGGGTITVDTQPGPVVVRGLQFAADDYTVTGGALTNNTANAPFRVGDGTTAGANMTGTIASAITGTGGVDKTDLGTLVLTGTNTHTGGTRVTGGTLQVSADTALGAAAAPLRLNGGTLRAGASFTLARPVALSATGGTIDTGANNVTSSGVISGAGGLTKRGTGVLTVSGANTFTGATTIAEGGLALANNGSLGSTTIAAGARLTGNGTIRGNLANSGQLAPGASPGTVTVTGNYTQSATGTYFAEIASATSFDRVVVTGTATLAGNLVVSASGGFTPVAGQSFKILEAAGGVTGTYASVTSPWSNISAMLRFQAKYNPSDVTLAFVQLPFAGLSGSASQQAIGKAVDQAQASGQAPALVAALNAFPTEDGVRAALGELSPRRYERWFEQAVYSTGALVRTVESRLGAPPHGGERRGGLWAEVVRRKADYDAVEESLQAEGTVDGIIVGGDIPLASRVQAGLVFAYADEGMKLDDAGSSTAADRFTAAAYARYASARAFVEVILGTSYTKHDGRRVVGITGYSSLAESTTDGQERFASVRAGLHLPIGATRITPYLGFQHIGWQADEIQESGAGDANLVVREQEAESLTSRVGVLAVRPFKGKSVTVTPTLDVAWRFEFRDEARELLAALGGAEFAVLTRAPNRSGFTAGLGLDAAFGSGLTAYTRLAGEWTGAADEAVEARAGVDFRF